MAIGILEDYSMTRYRKAEETLGDHVSQYS